MDPAKIASECVRNMWTARAALGDSECNSLATDIENLAQTVAEKVSKELTVLAEMRGNALQHYYRHYTSTVPASHHACPECDAIYKEIEKALVSDTTRIGDSLGRLKEVIAEYRDKFHMALTVLTRNKRNMPAHDQILVNQLNHRAVEITEMERNVGI